MKFSITDIVFSQKLLILVFSIVFSLIIFARFSEQAEARCHCCPCYNLVSKASDSEWKKTTKEINTHVTNKFNEHETWIINTLWNEHILPAMALMAEQLSAVAMQQVGIIGSFLDAKHQMETQRLFQKLQARAHKDYHPSIGMCEFGSNVKSLAASERKAEYNSVLMSQRSQDRSLGSAYTASKDGYSSDINNRIKQFREKFCDPQDNNNGLGHLCDHDQDGDLKSGLIGAQNPERMNKDIDFIRTVDAPWTLNIDFTDEKLTDNEEEVLALASNLYGHYVFARPPSELIKHDPTGVSAKQKHYMDMRSFVAKRSVAENSFNAIVGMKSQGTSGSKEFMESVLLELGVPIKDTGALLGGDTDKSQSNPSYYAQMEVLTKKIFQNPDFYTNLYDKPVNVDRKGVALQAIGLMQKFDLFKSYLRHEASLSILLELAVIPLQEEIEDKFSGKSEKEGDKATSQ